MSWHVLDNRATRARENGRGYVSLNENVAVFILVAALAARGENRHVSLGPRGAPARDDTSAPPPPPPPGTADDEAIARLQAAVAAAGRRRRL